MEIFDKHWYSFAHAWMLLERKISCGILNNFQKGVYNNWFHWKETKCYQRLRVKKYIILHSVPQGNVLEPILFSIYIHLINDL